jgi:MtrB/PioB family decaheme-associated outer membrane protein
MNKFLIASMILLLPAGVLAQEEGRIAASGSITAGVQQVDPDSPSSKFNEYRDIGNGAYLYDLKVEAVDTQTGLFLDLGGKNLFRDDQSVRLGVGSYGTWRLEYSYDEIPHNLSNNAMTVYNKAGDGVYVVPQLIPLGYQALVPTTGQMRALNDPAVATYAATQVHSVEIGTEREKNSVALTLTPSELLKFRLSYKDDRKDGDKFSYGPIGDRPPRTLNVQMAEPIDYVSQELRIEAELNMAWLQALVAYEISEFDNRIETLTWENIFFTPNAGDHTLTELESDGTTRRRVSSFGQRALAPDNRYQNINATVGIDLPLQSRLAATVAYGWMDQDQRLLPYSVSNLNTNWADTAKLPRTKADAEIETKLFNLDYTINPIARLNLRAFYRYYELDNETGSDQWTYVTQDTASAGSTVNYRNNRINLPYAYEKQNYGLDGRYSLAFWRTTLGLGIEREEIERDYREADTDENIVRATLSTRPIDWLSARVKYTYGDREGDSYNYKATDASYFYTTAQSPAAGDRDNPLYAFANHPDLRKYDVSDRERHQFNMSATVTPAETFDVTVAYNYRKDDFDSDVKPTQPLLNFKDNPIADVDRNRWTIGQQLGLLEEKSYNYGLDANYTPSERWSFRFFANREVLESDIRGMVFNENRRENPSAIGSDIANLGAWDDPRYLYNMTTKDRTNTAGIGGGYEILPGKLRLSADYTYSRGSVEWDYSGYGTDFSATATGEPNWEINQFGFRSPDTVRHVQNVLNVVLEYQVVENFIVGLHYLYDRFRSDDWLADADGPWVQETGSEYFLQDTSRDNRWGNRLVSMGNDLSPSYDNHVGFLTMTLKF